MRIVRARFSASSIDKAQSRRAARLRRIHLAVIEVRDRAANATPARLQKN
jgi:hypothetical protein